MRESREEDPESYPSQLWKETEWNGNHQAKDERSAYVSERSNKQRVPLERSGSVKKKKNYLVKPDFIQLTLKTALTEADLFTSKTSRLGTAVVTPNSAALDKAVSLTASKTEKDTQYIKISLKWLIFVLFFF